MPTKVDDVEMLQTYLKGVQERSEHHAGNVNKVIYTLGGLIVSFKDEKSSVSVMERDGELKNVLWFYRSGLRYALSYNHNSGKIEMREGSLKGIAKWKFDNNTLIEDLIGVFSSL